MKHENKLRLARKASVDVWSGGASALVLANRVKSFTGSDEALEVVNRVYTSSLGTATYECRECGQEHLTMEDASACCQEDPEHGI